MMDAYGSGGGGVGGLRRRAGLPETNAAAAESPKKPLLASLKKLDLYPKLVQEERVQTSSGAAVSIVTWILLAILLVSELVRYVTVKTEEHMVVDPTFGQKLNIRFNITFHGLHCGEVNLDAMDVAGDQQKTEEHEIWRTRLVRGSLTPIGEATKYLLPYEKQELDLKKQLAHIPKDYCGSCYGAETVTRKCCNTCEDVKAAYVERGWNAAGVAAKAEQCAEARTEESQAGLEGEACRVHGFMLVNKVAGNLNVAMGDIRVQDTRHIHQFNPALVPKYNVSHTIHELSFGLPFPGIENPLTNTNRFPVEGAGVYQFFIKLVPTVFTSAAGQEIHTNQYSVSTQFRPAVANGMRQNILPGVFFVYDLSPFMIKVTESRESLIELLTGLCAIAGGILTVSGILDSLLFRVTEFLNKRNRETNLGSF